ncbi:MAG: ATP-dependent DNA helicase [Polyangiales bacterium]
MLHRGVDAADYFGPYGSLAANVPAYEYRASQTTMARAVDRVLRDDGVLLVEAGTGTGKTWAYLLPAILSGRRVVISTATRALQDQIVDKDVPTLLKHTNLKADVVALKGLGNYVCKRRYAEFLETRRGDPRYTSLRQWVQESQSGDRAEFGQEAEDWSVWPEITSGTDTRIGSGCPFVEECFVSRVRQRAAGAQIVVVNHHLFFADLALRGPHPAAVLPDYDAVIFDEAHRLEDVATSFFGASVSTSGVERLIRDLQGTNSANSTQPDAR